MNYVEYIASFQQFSRLGLERIERMAFHLGNPQDSLNIIHVAGTNGKGSVCAMLACVMESAGYRVGKYISPELDKVNERISINGVDITDNELEELMHKIQPVVDRVQVEMGEMPSRFEVSTVGALVYYLDKKCDFVILETGLGGRLDATNICKKPLITVITTIDIDHAEYLGDTLEKVAFEKAGIIKQGVPCVSACQLDGVINVLNSVCQERESTLCVSDMDAVVYNGFDGMNERFGYKHWHDVKCGIAGLHQVINATLTLDTIEILRKNTGIDVPDYAVYGGIALARNRARLETLQNSPLIIFDGAHNLSGANALKISLERYFPNEKFTFVMAVMQDKDCKGMIRSLGSLAKGFIATEVPENPRALSAEDLHGIIKNMGYKVVCEKDVKNALRLIDDDTIICGSLYLYKYVCGMFSRLL